MNAPTLMLDDADLVRADVYALLSRILFAAPDAGLLAMLRQQEHLAEADDAVSLAWRALCAAADDEKRIADEYAALFVSIGRPPVEVYASWYLTGFLMEKPLAALRDDLAALDLSRQDGRFDSEDHMAGELEVMRHLVMRGDELNQRRFFQRHLLPWYGDFCAALATAADARFYRVAGDFMQAFLDVESDYFRLQSDGMEV